MNTNCPICKSESRIYKKNTESNYYQCSHCKSIFLSPMPTVNEMLHYANDNYSNGLYLQYVRARNMKVLTFQDRIKQIKDYLPKNKTIRHLDVGCSAGFMIEVGLNNGFDSYGVEFSKEAISQAKEEIKSRITQGDVNKLNESDKYDLVTCYDIIEHVQDPHLFLQSLKSLLYPGGILLITTPDVEHYLAKIMSKSWPMLQPKQHTILFSKKSLENTLNDVGLKKINQTAAYKVVSYEYLSNQLSELTPLLSKTMHVFGSILPQSVKNKSIKLNISEFLTVAQK